MDAMNLLHTLYAHRTPDSAALVFADGTACTTAQLVARIGCYAAALHELGVGRGERVSFKLDKSAETLFLAHACLRLGAVIHPLNSAYTDQEMAYLLADAAPVLLVCEPGAAQHYSAMADGLGIRIETLAAGGGGTLAARAAAAGLAIPAVAAVGPDAVAALLYTSGTTGKPKGALITHRNLADSAAALAAVWQLGTGDVLLHALPLYHAHGLLTSINTLLVAGGAILLLPSFDAAQVLAALPAATVMMGVPTHYARLLREPALAAAVTPSFRLFISGSAPLPLALADQFYAQTGRRIVERYGLTEAAIVTALPAGAANRAGWVGWPLDGVEVRVATADGTRASLAATGVLETRGHNVFAGYLNQPGADREAFTDDGWFITGDVAEIDGEGCVRLLDRARDLVITGGLNVYPREVEIVLDGLPGIAQSAVFGVPHPDFGEAVVAAVELAPGACFDEAPAIAAARSSLAAYKTPKRIIPVLQIPRNGMGKVLKAELRARFGTLFVPPKP
jgi:malonyl-CoA/methylmalonyl-CoA synthetase